MGEDRESQHEGTGDEAAEGQGGVQEVASGEDAGGGDDKGGPDAATPERQMESGPGTVQSTHGEVSPPGEGATTQQRSEAEETRKG